MSAEASRTPSAWSYGAAKAWGPGGTVRPRPRVHRWTGARDSSVTVTVKSSAGRVRQWPVLATPGVRAALGGGSTGRPGGS